MSSKKQIHKVTKPHPDLSKELLWKKPLFWQTAIFGLAVLLYANTIKHGYALDDVISITMNSFTKKGFAGFKDILTKMKSDPQIVSYYYKQGNQVFPEYNFEINPQKTYVAKIEEVK